MNMRFRSHKYPKEDEEYVDTTHYDKDSNNLDIGYQRLKLINPKMYSQLSHITSLFVDHNNLTSLPDAGSMPHIKELNCSHNLLTQIPFYPKLTFLNISNNKITSIKSYDQSNLKYLDCSFNPGISFDISLSFCKHLYINDNNLTEVDLSGISRLQYLDCSNNNLVAINPSESLIELNSQRNHLIDLPILPNIKILMTDDNTIKMIQTYPQLTILTASHNNLVHIDPQPSLTKLIASHNYLEQIGHMPCLEILDVCYNRLRRTQIPHSIQSISVHFNYITDLELSDEALKNIRDIQVSFNTYQTIYKKFHEYFQSIHVKVSTDKLNELLQQLEPTIGNASVEYLKAKFRKIKFQEREEMLLIITLKIFWLLFPRYKSLPLDSVKTPEFSSLYDGISKLYYKTIVMTLIFKEV